MQEGMWEMNDWVDVQRLLKSFGTIIYTGNRLDDLALAELELEDLYEMKLIEQKEYFATLMIIRRERQKLEPST
jgi:uncharacterized protein YqgQ